MAKRAWQCDFTTLKNKTYNSNDNTNSTNILDMSVKKIYSKLSQFKLEFYIHIFSVLHGQFLSTIMSWVSDYSAQKNESY